MAFDSRSMTFAAVLTMHVAEQDMDDIKSLKNRDISAPYEWSIKAGNLGAAFHASGMWRASFPAPGAPSKRPLLMLPAPSVKVCGDTKAIKSDSKKTDAREPRRYDLVIYNTERMPASYVRAMLIRVFDENAQSAQLKSLFQRHIHEGPYSRDVAQTKAREVRSDASQHGAPVPELRYVRR